MKKIILFITLSCFSSLTAQEDLNNVLISKYYNKYLKINKKEGSYTIHDTILKVTYAKVDNKLAFFTNISEFESDDYYLTTSKINNYLNEDSSIVSEVEAISNEKKQVRIIFTEESFAVSDDEIEYRYLYYKKESNNEINTRKKTKAKTKKR
jgi:hypothetical protein